MFLYVSRIKSTNITDGSSRTMMIGEVVLADQWESSNTWSYALVNADCLRSTRNPLNKRPGEGFHRAGQNGAFGSLHPHGANFCFADAHVEFVSEAIDLATYQAQSTIGDREPVVAK